MGKDWIGNHKSTHATLGSSSHSREDRQEHDYYATDPVAVDLLLEQESFDGGVWEPACGEGHISERLKALGLQVYSTDLISRSGYASKEVDFLATSMSELTANIITNPPYKYAQEFIEKSIDSVQEGKKVCMFLKLQFLEGKKRRALFAKYPPKTVYVSSSRIVCAKNGDFEEAKKLGGSAVAYCWYVWVKGFKGETTLKWIN